MGDIGSFDFDGISGLEKKKRHLASHTPPAEDELPNSIFKTLIEFTVVPPISV